MVGCTIYPAFPYLEDYPVGYVDMCRLLLRRCVLLYEVRHYHLAEGHAVGTLFPFGIGIGIRKEKHGPPGQHTELFLPQLASASCRQPYIAGEEGGSDNGTLLGFYQNRHLVRIDIQQVFPEKALGKLPFLRQYPLPFQYAVYPVHCRCLSVLYTVSVLGIVLHHLACPHLVLPVNLPEDDCTVTGCSQTVILH